MNVVAQRPKSRHNDLIAMKKRIDRYQWTAGGAPAAILEGMEVLKSRLHIPCAALRETVRKIDEKKIPLFHFFSPKGEAG